MSNASPDPTPFLAAKARDLANQLFDASLCTAQMPGPAGPPSCLARECRRPPADPLGKGLLRMFDQFDPSRLCLSCRACWYAEMAAQILERRVAPDACVANSQKEENAL